MITKPEHLCPPFLYFFENIGAGEVNNIDHPVTMQCTGGRCVPRGTKVSQQNFVISCSVLLTSPVCGFNVLNNKCV